nr:uncharacterized protein haspin isoform X1 [Nothobranchius furzeri]
MQPSKPLYLKTYSKRARKLTAWILPEDHQRGRIFDSTPCSDDTSALEPEPTQRRPRKKRTIAGINKKMRSAKRKALLCLTEKSDAGDLSDEENVSPPRGRHTKVGVPKEQRSARGKAVSFVTDLRSNEENVSDEENVSPLHSVPAYQSRETRHVSAPVFTRQRVLRLLSRSISKKETSALKVSAKWKSGGRFVTRRRCAASAKPRISTDSSNEFTCSIRTRQAVRKKQVISLFGLSSAESSVNLPGVSSFATAPFREISLNESGDHSLVPCSRKPIFCSTPSAASCRNRGNSKPNQVTTPPSVSVSRIGAFNSSQGDLDPTRQPLSSPQSASLSGLSDNNKDRSLDLFLERERGSLGEGARSLSGCSGSKWDEEFPSLEPLSADNESNSHFVSAAGNVEWLIQPLKQKCLSTRCTIHLERLAHLPVTRLCNQTTYSSCVEHSVPVDSHPCKTPPVDSSQNTNAESLQREDSVINKRRSDNLGSVNSLHLYLSNSLSDESNHLSAGGCEKSDELSNIKAHSEEEESVIYIGSHQLTDHKSEIQMDTQVLPGNAAQTPLTEKEKAKERSVCVKSHVILRRRRLSQQQLVSFTQQKDVATTRETFLNQPVNRPEEGSPPFLRAAAKRKHSSCEKAAGSTPLLKKKRLRTKRTVKPKVVPPKPSSGVSESAIDEQTGISPLSETDKNAAKVGSKYGSSVGSTASDKDAENYKPVPTREKMPLPPKNKKKSVFKQQMGTTRKACVSGRSVSRWKNKGCDDAFLFRAEKRGNTDPVDCSINELISKQYSQSKFGVEMNFSTPMRAAQRDMLTSLVSDLSSRTPTWSRLKSALSVHRKVQLTPSRLTSASLGTPSKFRLADVSLDLFATPRRATFPSQLLKQHSLSLCEDLSDAEKVYAECGQHGPLPWEECILPDRMKRCVKIGEGTFGEVFSTTNASGDTVALKIIPVEGQEKVNGEDQKNFGEILHEIIISKELSSLKEKQQNQTCGFIGLNDLHCVKGNYPPDFLKAWDLFDRRKVSENDRPDFFENNQLFIILEFEFGGVDLEHSNGKLASLAVAKSILHQVTAALAVAEQELHFEHRDLHWGNVLVKTTKQKTLNFLLNGTGHCVETSGVVVHIIDYSLSRLEIDELTVSCDISNDQELFMGQGDYQFEIYRLMRQENGNNWSDYYPHSNVLWLHYLSSKLLALKYRNSRGKGTQSTRKELTGFHDNVLQYRSATEALQNCPMFNTTN